MSRERGGAEASQSNPALRQVLAQAKPQPIAIESKPDEKPVDAKPAAGAASDDDKRLAAVKALEDKQALEKAAGKKKAAQRKPVEAKTIDVKTQGPAGIQWSAAGKALGAGAATFKVPESTRGGRSTVAVVNGVANYAALHSGKIHPRASPFADVFLGSELLGTTPFPAVRVVAGKYTLRFVHEGKEQERTVDVNGAETVKVAVDFNAP